MESLWIENHLEKSVTYPLKEILRRATLKIKMHDRNIPMTSDAWGMFPELIKRFRKLKKWKVEGVTFVKIFYDDNYYFRNAHTIHLLDPLHIFFVKKYSAIK